MTTDRLAQLESDKPAALNAEIAKLRAERPAPPLPPVKDEGVRVVPILTEPSSLPRLKEVERLYNAVRGLSPWPEALVDRYDDARPFRGFSSALRWVQSMPRADRPNGKVALSYWIDCGKNRRRDRNCMTSDLSANALVLAVFAAGDVCYCPANSQLGVVWEIGLLEYGGRAAAPDAWRRVMREGGSATPCRRRHRRVGWRR